MGHRVKPLDYKGEKEKAVAAEEAAKGPQPFKLCIEIEVDPNNWTDEESMTDEVDEFEAACISIGDVKKFDRSDV